MTEKIINMNLFKGKSAAGVQVNILPDNKLAVNIVILKRKKTRLETENKYSSLSSFDEVTGNIPKSIPVCLNIDGKGVIHKKIETNKDDTDRTILDQALPNAAQEEIFMQKTETPDGACYISVVRKEIINNVLGEFRAAGRHVVSLTLGVFPVNGILGILNSKENTIQTSGYITEIRDTKINEIRKEQENSREQTFRIGNEELQTDMLVPFAAAFEYFFNPLTISEQPDIIRPLSENYVYKKIFVTAGWSVLVFFFILLLTNFLLFDKYNRQYNDLSYRISQNKDLLSRLDTLKKEMEQKEEFITKGGLLRSSRNSFYADRIAYMLPQDIMLTEMDICPLKKKITESKEPEFMKNVIHVSGITKKSTLLDEWIKEVGKEQWVDDINILNYTQESDKRTGEFEVEIRIER